MRTRKFHGAAIFAVFIASCGSDSKPNDGSCNASNCSGCCSNGVCQGGGLTTACGSGGESCSSCGMGLSCIGGSCQMGSSETCSSANCAGCCLNNTCQGGNTAAACGKSGASCTACAMNQICRTDQTCGVDPNSMWRIQPTSASITATNNGTDWDGDASPPDVIVEMICPPSSAPVMSSTPEVEGYSPTWSSGGCTARASTLLAEDFFFQVLDSDLAVNDTITTPLRFRFTEEHFVAGAVDFQATGGLQSLRVELQRQ